MADDLKKAVESGKVPPTELDDHVHRILRSMFATGVIDDPPQKSVVDVVGGFEVAQKIAEQSTVLLKNDHAQLPLDASKIHSIAVIGPHADVGMISGGGSAQVDPPGGNAIMPPGKGQTHWQEQIWFPTSPLKAIRAKAPDANVQFDSGADPAAAAALAKTADVAIVFAYQWESEGMDLESLSLPEHQDDLIAKVAAANPHTIVVLETGGPVTMPWVDQVSGILEAWFRGQPRSRSGGECYFWRCEPQREAADDLPQERSRPAASHDRETAARRPVHADQQGWKRIAAGLPAFQVTYDEGVKVGYKWYDAENKPVLFPFGYGLSYTTYSYSNLKVTPGKNPRVTFTVTNTGNRAGAEVAQVYASLPAAAAEPPKRLVGWSKVKLNGGESKEVTVEVDPKYLSIFNVEHNGWQLLPGDYGFMVGGSSQSLPLKESVTLK